MAIRAPQGALLYPRRNLKVVSTYGDPESEWPDSKTCMSAHIPVLTCEIMEALAPSPGGRYIDGTVGAAGHAHRILELSAPTGVLLGVDADPKAIALARQRLKIFGDRAVILKGNYACLREIATACGFVGVQGVLLDMGLSSVQLADERRGFSFRADGPLDMRFDPTDGPTAADLVNRLSESGLADLLYRYGEERHSRRIARAICRWRPFQLARELADLVEATVGRRGRIHPATRTFQALRIAVNRELDALASVLPQAVGLLAAEGRLAVITFHSLEDRLVKDFMRREARDCICPPDMPVCSCDHRATLRIVTRKPVRPSPGEVKRNPRSRSAKLRVAARLP